MHPKVFKAFQEIDAAVFNSDSFDESEDQDQLFDYVKRWSNEIERWTSPHEVEVEQDTTRAALQRESSNVNELNGVMAFLVGVLTEIDRCTTVEDARTCAEMALQNLAEYRAGIWKPGPHDDAADWRPNK